MGGVGVDFGPQSVGAASFAQIMQGLGLLFLRLVVGGLFLSQGLPKLVPMWGGSPADTANIFQSVGHDTRLSAGRRHRHRGVARRAP